MQNEEKNKTLGGVLYLVATPIGNTADISERARKVLTEADFIAAEDTRNTAKLLSLLGIPRREMISYHDHNRAMRGGEIVARLSRGESCALVSDAGMPAISDPGADLVKLCADAAIPVTVIPGGTAAITALALSALSTARFAFEGFLPIGSERKKRLSEIKNERRTLIFYEAPHKLRATLSDLLSVFGDRKISICRELTKKNEEILRLTLTNAIHLYKEEDPRGEYVLILEGAEELGLPLPVEANSPTAGLSPEEKVAYYEKEGFSRMDAIKAAAKELGIPKSELYRKLNHEDENTKNTKKACAIWRTPFLFIPQPGRG